jgi:O-antigen biosynthesis protein
MKKFPSVSILIVNYNGSHLLPDCLSSLENLDYPKEKTEVIVVDNNSVDSSIEFIKKNYPWVKVIESSENLGFAGGNNLGYQHSTGEYIVLLNNDTRVDRGWLNALVMAAKNDKVGIVASKLLLATKFLELTITSNLVSKSSLDNSIDFSPVGIIVEDLICNNSKINNLVWYESGFYKKDDAIISTHWCKDVGKILIPFEDNNEETYTLTIHGYPTENNIKTPVTIRVGKKFIFNQEIRANEVKQITFSIKYSVYEEDFIQLVQNAGNVLLSDGYSKDRGSLVKRIDSKNFEFYERDSKHFDKKTKLLAACGAACLIKREVINKIGFFDGTYFMYYEDTDFSLRAWRNGWDIVYEPQALVHHKHKASTSSQSSEFFLYLIEKNHLLFLSTHFPIKTILGQFFKLLSRALYFTLKYNVFRFSDNLERTELLGIKKRTKTNAIRYILTNLSRIVKNRLFWHKRSKRGYQEMKEYIY